MTLIRTGFIPIPPGAAPGFDHADSYANNDSSVIYVAHTGADRVDVIDCPTRQWLRALPDHPGVAGVLVEAGLLFTSDRAAARVAIYRCADETLLGQVDVGAHPNGLAYGTRRGRLFCFNLGEPVGENCTATVVDVTARQPTATIPLPGRPRWAAYDPDTDRVYANIRDPAQILVIDAGTLSAVTAFDVPATGPHGLVLDADRLYCACDGGALVVLDRAAGTVLATLSLPGAPDVVMHDAVAGRLYVAIGDPGVIAVIDTRSLEPAEITPTEPGAHTLGIDAPRHTVYAFQPASSGAAVYEEA